MRIAIPTRPAAALLFVTAGALACRGPWPADPRSITLPFEVDSVRQTIVDDGVVHRFFYAAAGPWAINVLEARTDRCWSLAALKSSGMAAGRSTTSALVRERAARERVAGGVNADFFLFTPPGVPVGLLVVDGRVITGPIAQPVVAIDSTGRPVIARFEIRGHAAWSGRRVPVAGWNRPVPAGLAYFDRGWGTATDSATGVLEIVLAGGPAYRVIAVDTALAGVAIPPDGGVLRLGRAAADTLRRAMQSLAADTPVSVEVALAPFGPREAVGGRPELVRGGTIAARLDTVGRAGFAEGRHPRTAAGVTRDGARILLVTVDGRQAPYSDGMSLAELAGLMQALGAHDAVNLDGGGSTAMVVAQSGEYRVVNRPSDADGERPVGDAVALVRRCAR